MRARHRLAYIGKDLPGRTGKGNCHVQIILCAEPADSRRWLPELADRLAAAGHDVRLRRRQPVALPAAVRQLERLEAVLRPPGRSAALADPVAWSDLRIREDVVGGDGARPAERCVLALPAGAATPDDVADATHVVTFDGAADVAAVYASLLDHVPPVIAIVATATGEVIASGRPSLEAAGSLREGLDAVYARLITLIEAVAAGAHLGAMQVPLAHEVCPAPDRAVLARHAVRTLKHKAVRALYALCCHIPHWRIGWRLNTGPGVWERQDLLGPQWQTLPDPGDHFYADPFPVVHAGRRWILFEDFPHATGKGIISAIEIGDRGPVGPVRPVLEESCHLSYPFVFEHDGAIWMVPETHQKRTVDLYRAVAFPHRWEKVATLLSGVEASDATIIHHGGRFWMFAAVRNGWGAWSDTLCLYMADALLGPWRPHPANPVLIDGATARPAGNMVVRDGGLWRPVQDCSTSYGAALGLVEVTRLDPQGYDQVLRKRLTAGPAWPGRRLHTLNRHADLECIDGSALAPRNPWLARHTQRWTLRRGTADQAGALEA